MTEAEYKAKLESLVKLQGECRNKITELQGEFNKRGNEIISLRYEYGNEIAPFKFGDIIKFKRCSWGKVEDIIFRVDSIYYYSGNTIEVKGRKLCKDGITPSNANKDKVDIFYTIGEKVYEEKAKTEYFYSASEYIEAIKTSSNE